MVSFGIVKRVGEAYTVLFGAHDFVIFGEGGEGSGSVKFKRWSILSGSQGESSHASFDGIAASFLKVREWSWARGIQ